MSNNKPDRLDPGPLNENTTSFLTPAAKAVINRHSRLFQNIDGQNGIQVTPMGDRMTITNTRRMGAVSIFAEVSWSSGSSDYSWIMQRRNSAGTGWENFTADDGGMSSTDENQRNAVHVAGVDDLPNNLLVNMFRVPQAAASGNATMQWMFNVPLQLDTSFTHRSNVSSSPTAGNRQDLTMTSAQLNTEEASADLDWSIEGQGDKMGVVYTVPSRGIVYNGSGDAKIYGYVTDIELDVMGNVVSRSEEMRYEIHTPAEC